MTGGCACGAVRFEITGPLSEIELCYCNKCRRSYGSAFAATLYVRIEHFAWRAGRSERRQWDAPLEHQPPAYRHSFCGRCGAPLPITWDEDDDAPLPFAEVPVASLDTPPERDPAYRMFESQCPAWARAPESARWFEGASPIEEKVVVRLLRGPKSEPEGR